ncbi:unnamed protein product [Parnassius apollo]|uniref:(apollo) hypothetical protein n=1 Tax=Parnassius apollo TaxID=110799 RepID=A0A8S3XDM6_PARAO|nr:unnamed protein product [Parnassius apollo]
MSLMPDVKHRAQEDVDQTMEFPNEDSNQNRSFCHEDSIQNKSSTSARKRRESEVIEVRAQIKTAVNVLKNLSDRPRTEVNEEPSQPHVSYTADTEDRIPSPAEIELLALPSAAEDTPITVPANVTSPPAHPVSPVLGGPSNSRTIQGERSPVSAALLHLVVAVSDSEDCDKHHLTEPPASLWQ